MENQLSVTIIGYGNQAKAWALNLRDSGVDIKIGLRTQSDSFSKAEQDGFKTFDMTSTPINTSICALLTPDDTHLSILENLLSTKTLIVLAHGFSFVAENLQTRFPQLQFALLAPKAIASELRFRFETNQSLAAFYSLEACDEKFEQELKTLGECLGFSNLYETSFLEETQADLFSEQSLLCSVLPYTMNLAFNTLVEQGFKKELAFYECFVEAKLIIDTIIKVGPEAFFDFISPNALVGSEMGRSALIDSDFEEKYQAILRNVLSPGHFDTLTSSDVASVKKEVTDFWKKQNLNKTFHELKETL